MEKSSGRCLVIHRQQEHNRACEGGRSARVLARSVFALCLWCRSPSHGGAARCLPGSSIHPRREHGHSHSISWSDTAYYSRICGAAQFRFYPYYCPAYSNFNFFLHKDAEVCQSYRGQ